MKSYHNKRPIEESEEPFYWQSKPSAQSLPSYITSSYTGTNLDLERAAAEGDGCFPISQTQPSHTRQPEAHTSLPDQLREQVKEVH